MSTVHLDISRMIRELRLIADIESLETKKAGPFLTLPIAFFYYGSLRRIPDGRGVGALLSCHGTSSGIFHAIALGIVCGPPRCRYLDNPGVVEGLFFYHSSTPFFQSLCFTISRSGEWLPCPVSRYRGNGYPLDTQ